MFLTVLILFSLASYDLDRNEQEDTLFVTIALPYRVFIRELQGETLFSLLALF